MAKTFMNIRSGIGFKPGTAPSDPTNGDAYYDASTNKLTVYQNGAWATFGGSGAIADGGTGATTVEGARQNLGIQPTFNGLEDSSKFTVGYTASTRVLTVTYASGAAVWVGGTRYTKTGVDTLTAHTNASGKYYFYYDSSGALTQATSVPDILITATVAIVYYNATTVSGIVFNELHPAATGMDNATHKYLHLVRGTQTMSGFAISGYTLDTAGSTALSYAVDSGVIADEDLFHNINPLTDGGPYRILYRSGASGEWTWDDTSTTGILDNGTNIYYNQFTGGAWQLTPITVNSTWINYYVFVVPEYSATKQTVVVMGQNTHASLTAAQSEDPSTGIAGIASLTDEGVYIYRLTYRRLNSTPSNAQLTSVQGLRSNVISVSSGFNPTDHQSLSNRSATDAHPSTSVSVDTTSFANALTGTEINVQLALNKLDKVPQWKKVTLSHTAFQTAALTYDIELFSLPAKTMIHQMVLKHSVQFAGTGFTSYTLGVGIATNLNKYAQPLNVLQSVSEDAKSITQIDDVESFSGATSVRIQATSAGANLNQSTAGSIDVWVLMSVLP